MAAASCGGALPLGCSNDCCRPACARQGRWVPQVRKEAVPQVRKEAVPQVRKEAVPQMRRMRRCEGRSRVATQQAHFPAPRHALCPPSPAEGSAHPWRGRAAGLLRRIHCRIETAAGEVIWPAAAAARQRRRSGVRRCRRQRARRRRRRHGRRLRARRRRAALLLHLLRHLSIVLLLQEGHEGREAHGWCCWGGWCRRWPHTGGGHQRGDPPPHLQAPCYLLVRFCSIHGGRQAERSAPRCRGGRVGSRHKLVWSTVLVQRAGSTHAAGRQEPLHASSLRPCSRAPASAPHCRACSSAPEHEAESLPSTLRPQHPATTPAAALTSGCGGHGRL